MGVLGDTPNDATVALNFVRQRAPLASDDIDAGYGVGAHWTDTANEKVYLCTSHAVDDATWVEVTGTVPPTEPPDEGWPPQFDTNGIGGYVIGWNYGINDAATLAQLSMLGTAQMQHGGWGDLVFRYKAANPRGCVTGYNAVCEAHHYQTLGYGKPAWSTQRISHTLVTHNEALGHDSGDFTSDTNGRWILRNSDGTVKIRQTSYLMDVGVQSFRDASVANQLEKWELEPLWDGVFYDNICAFLSVRRDKHNSPAYKYIGGTGVTGGSLQQVYTDTTYANITVDFISYLYPIFHGLGKVVWSNAIARWDVAQYGPWWLRIAPYMDGVMSETRWTRVEDFPGCGSNNEPAGISQGYPGAWGSRPIGTAWYQQWAQNLDAIVALNDAGTAFMGQNEVYGIGQDPLTYVTPCGFDARERNDYSRASFLLTWSGGVNWYLDQYGHSGNVYYPPSHGYFTHGCGRWNSGQPVGPKWPNCVQQNGVYMRQYENGWVAVNPQWTARTATIGGVQRTLQPISAYVGP